MKELCNMSDEELLEIIKAKMEKGQEEYGDNDLDRYNLYDIFEELADSINIAKRFVNKLKHLDDPNDFEKSIIEGDNIIMSDLIAALDDCVSLLKDLDGGLSKEAKNDDKGGVRIGIGDINNFKEDDK